MARQRKIANSIIIIIPKTTSINGARNAGKRNQRNTEKSTSLPNQESKYRRSIKKPEKISGGQNTKKD